MSAISLIPIFIKNNLGISDFQCKAKLKVFSYFYLLHTLGQTRNKRIINQNYKRDITFGQIEEGSFLPEHGSNKKCKKFRKCKESSCKSSEDHKNNCKI